MSSEVRPGLSRDLGDLLLAGLVVDLMGEVRREDVGLIAGYPYGKRQRQLAPFDADVYAALVDVAQDVVGHRFAVAHLQETAVRVVLDVAVPGALEAFEAADEPGAAGLEEAEARVGVLVEHAVEDDAGGS